MIGRIKRKVFGHTEQHPMSLEAWESFPWWEVDLTRSYTRETETVTVRGSRRQLAEFNRIRRGTDSATGFVR